MPDPLGDHISEHQTLDRSIEIGVRSADWTACWFHHFDLKPISTTNIRYREDTYSRCFPALEALFADGMTTWIEYEWLGSITNVSYRTIE